jgi:hypothetical protein
MNFAAALRRDLAERAQKFAQSEALPHSLGYGEVPIVCFAPYEHDSRHGNFLQGSYKAIRANRAWHKRLAKVHTQGRRSLPSREEGRWMELDSCTSSDALLMNIFCHPSVLSTNPRNNHHLRQQRNYLRELLLNPIRGR